MVSITGEAAVTQPRHGRDGTVIHARSEQMQPLTLGSLLELTPGTWEFVFELPGRLVAELRALQAAEMGRVPSEKAILIPFDHLRGLPLTTEVSLGVRVSYTDEEHRILGHTRSDPAFGTSQGTRSGPSE